MTKAQLLEYKITLLLFSKKTVVIVCVFMCCFRPRREFVCKEEL